VQVHEIVVGERADDKISQIGDDELIIAAAAEPPEPTAAAIRDGDSDRGKPGEVSELSVWLYMP
jgi:hypothetical protein